LNASRIQKHHALPLRDIAPDEGGQVVRAGDELPIRQAAFLTVVWEISVCELASAVTRPLLQKLREVHFNPALKFEVPYAAVDTEAGEYDRAAEPRSSSLDFAAGVAPP
jgi:hypothetical protein